MPDVVVVGAGVIGASVAWHLSRLGVRTLLLEREPEPGKGSTGRATGGFRAQYGTDINVRLSLLSREKLRRFIDDTGVDPGYDPRGYLWLARTEAQLDILRGAQDVQLAAGLVEASMLDLRQIREVNPYIRLDGLAGAGRPARPGIDRRRARLARAGAGKGRGAGATACRNPRGPYPVLGGSVRDVARPARAARPRAGMRQPVPLQRLLRARRHALAGARAAAGRDHRARPVAFARRGGAAAFALRRRTTEPRDADPVE